MHISLLRFEAFFAQSSVGVPTWTTSPRLTLLWQLVLRTSVPHRDLSSRVPTDQAFTVSSRQVVRGLQSQQNLPEHPGSSMLLQRLVFGICRMSPLSTRARRLLSPGLFRRSPRLHLGTVSAELFTLTFLVAPDQKGLRSHTACLLSSHLLGCLCLR